MTINRSGFLAAAGAMSVASLKLSTSSKATDGPRLGPALTGCEFMGMAGAFSAMLTPFDKVG